MMAVLGVVLVLFAPFYLDVSDLRYPDLLGSSYVCLVGSVFVQFFAPASVVTLLCLRYVKIRMKTGVLASKRYFAE